MILKTKITQESRESNAREINYFLRLCLVATKWILLLAVMYILFYLFVHYSVLLYD